MLAVMVKKVLGFFARNQFKVAAICIVLIAAILRFYNYPSRIEVGGDNARDIMVAHEALIRHHLPLVGPFSSAGPFVTGPLYFWILMLATVLMPNVFMSPWLVTTFLATLTVITMMYIGFLLQGRRLAIIVGLLSAFSPQWLGWATFLSNPTYIIVIAPLILLFYILLYKKREVVYALLLGAAYGLALNMHYQALNLGIFFLAILFIPVLSWRKRVVSFFVSIGGFLLAMLPFLWWDSQQQFTNIRNILDYFLIGQYRIYVPNSWKIFLFQSLPNNWSSAVGGYFFIGFILMILAIIYGLLLLKSRRKEQNITKIIFICFSILLLVNRYYRGEKGENYLLYLSPLILIFSALSIDYFFYSLIYQYINKKSTGLICLSFVMLAVVISNFIFFLPNLNATTHRYQDIQNQARQIEQIFPNARFQLYDYQGKSTNISQGVSAVLAAHNRESSEGIPIGIMCEKCFVKNPKIIAHSNGTKVIGLTTKDTANKSWRKMNQADVYDYLVVWLEEHNLKSTFYLGKFIQSKLQ
jgi:4-amino-4-deoxy-L-arabinose transferase-like glycosyltransferase